MEEVRALIGQVLDQYTKVVKLDPTNWNDEREIALLNKAFELDESGLTMFMLVRGLYDRFLKDTKFSAKYILDDTAKFTETIRAIRALYDLVEDPTVVDLITEFERRVLTSAGFYGMDPDEQMKLAVLLEDKYSVASLRLSALRSMEDLEACQFMQGEASAYPLKVNKWVFEFWNVNSLIAAMRGQQVDGVSLCLIRDPEQVFASYFVFAVNAPFWRWRILSGVQRYASGLWSTYRLRRRMLGCVYLAYQRCVGHARSPNSLGRTWKMPVDKEAGTPADPSQGAD